MLSTFASCRIAFSKHRFHVKSRMMCFWKFRYLSALTFAVLAAEADTDDELVDFTWEVPARRLGQVSPGQIPEHLDVRFRINGSEIEIRLLRNRALLPSNLRHVLHHPDAIEKELSSGRSCGQRRMRKQNQNLPSRDAEAAYLRPRSKLIPAHRIASKQPRLYDSWVRRIQRQCRAMEKARSREEKWEANTPLDTCRVGPLIADMPM